MLVCKMLFQIDYALCLGLFKNNISICPWPGAINCTSNTVMLCAHTIQISRYLNCSYLSSAKGFHKAITSNWLISSGNMLSAVFEQLTLCGGRSLAASKCSWLATRDIIFTTGSGHVPNTPKCILSCNIRLT